MPCFTTSEFLQAAEAKGVFLFVRGSAEDRVRARMFAPGAGIVEDPATGSAAAALAGYLGGRPGLGRGLARLGYPPGRGNGPAEPDRDQGERQEEKSWKSASGVPRFP